MVEWSGLTVCRTREGNDITTQIFMDQLLSGDALLSAINHCFNHYFMISKAVSLF